MVTTPRHGRGHGPRLPWLLPTGPIRDHVICLLSEIGAQFLILKIIRLSTNSLTSTTSTRISSENSRLPGPIIAKNIPFFIHSTDNPFSVILTSGANPLSTNLYIKTFILLYYNFIHVSTFNIIILVGLRDIRLFHTCFHTSLLLFGKSLNIKKIFASL